MDNNQTALDVYGNFTDQICDIFFESISGHIIDCIQSLHSVKGKWVEQIEVQEDLQPVYQDILSIELLLINIDFDLWHQHGEISINKGIEMYLSSCRYNVFRVIRSFQRIKNDWMETSPKLEGDDPILIDMNAIETLLVYIAEAFVFQKEKKLENSKSVENINIEQVSSK